MGFQEWLKVNETGTSTADIAGFSRMCMPMVRRTWPTEVEDMEDLDPKKRKKKKQPQVEN